MAKHKAKKLKKVIDPLKKDAPMDRDLLKKIKPKK